MAGTWSHIPIPRATQEAHMEEFSHILVFYSSKSRVHQEKLSVKYSNLIQLVELHLPCFPDLPAHYQTSNGLPDRLMPALYQLIDMHEPAVSKILKTLKPDILIHDFVHSWAPPLANSYNIPAVEFITFNASFTSFFVHFCENCRESIKEYPFPEIYLSSFERIGFAEMEKPNNGNFLRCMKASNKIVLLETFQQIEGKYLDHLEAYVGKRMIPTGPLVEDPTEEDDHNCDEFKTWLDEKDPRSAVFVSFGSEYYSSKEELEEIAIGLELSRLNFIWVVRFPIGESNSMHQVLPNGFLERVKGRGLVVEGWAPQTRILSHPGIGGFVSHCGVGSAMESLKLGVPIIAMPMCVDQPIVARLLKSLALAMEVQRDGEGRYCREEIARVLKKVVVEEEGKHLRRNAQDMSCLMVEKGDEEIDEVVKELFQLCKEANNM